MVRPAFVLSILLLSAACGSAPAPQSAGARSEAVSFDNEDVSRFASGPIASACLIHDRRDANIALCGCVQAAADITLDQSDQQRGVRFFAEPELINDIKISDTPANERFWERWDRFSETAESLCGSL